MTFGLSDAEIMFRQCLDHSGTMYNVLIQRLGKNEDIIDID